MEIRVKADGPSDDLLRDLYAWLNGGEWGPVRIHEGPSTPDTLGPIADALTIASGSIGSLASLAGVIVAWLQYRKSDVKVTIVIGDRGNPISVGAEQAHANPAAAGDALTEQLEHAMHALPGGADSSDSTGGNDAS